MSESAKPQDGYLTGQLLVAMPGMEDPRFEKSVIYICAHSEEGAMGLVVNRLVESMSFPDLLEQLDIEPTDAAKPVKVHFGGPVETQRGFMFHSTDYLHDASLKVTDSYALTASVEILKKMAHGDGPAHCLLALGYAGWGPGQLDDELQKNGWLSVKPSPDLVFDTDLENKWDRAIATLGISPSQLSGSAGHA